MICSGREISTLMKGSRMHGSAYYTASLINYEAHYCQMIGLLLLKLLHLPSMILTLTLTMG